MPSDCVWIVDDDKSIRWVLEKALAQAGIACELLDSGDAALRRLKDEQPTVIVSDVRMKGASGFDVLAQVQQLFSHIPVIIMTAHSDLESAVKTYQGGAFDYLPKPFDIDEAVALVRRALVHAHEQAAKQPLSVVEESTGIIGEAPAMQDVFRVIGRLSQSPIAVLINGESGTGKELVARALHRHSPRAHKPFIALNMAAIPTELIESELFGHEKGAFTGAAMQRQGRFEQAAGGTLFLDEIGDMPLDVQTRLLRVLSDGTFYRVGGHTEVKADVRVIAATHQNLEAMVKQGRFREDLFHRINVIRIQLPRLSERREDIPRLAAFFLQKTARELNVEPRILLPETEKYLCQLDWPGNVRQLENTCRWLTVMASSREVMVSDLPSELRNTEQGKETAGHWEGLLRQWADYELAQGAHGLLDRAVPVFERVMIEAALFRTGGRRREAAELLGWGRNTLTRKLKELGMESHGEDDEE